MSNIAGKLEAAERARAACEREVAELKRQLAEKSTLSSVSNNPAVAPYKKLIKMGVPRNVVEQKMRTDGFDPSMLNGGPMLGQSSAPSRPAGNPMAGLFSGIASAAAARGPVNTTKLNFKTVKPDTNTPTNSKSAALKVAAAAAAKRAAMGVVNINAKLAGMKASVSKETDLSGELGRRFKSMHRENDSDSEPGSPIEPPSPVAGTVVGNLQYSNTNENGKALPAGIRRVSDKEDTWYELTGTGVSNWTLESLLKKKNSVKYRKGGRRANRKSSRKNRKSRRSN